MNVLIYALRASSQKLGFNTVNAAFEADLRLTAESGPPNNLYPMTLKQVKSVVGVSTDHSAFLRDACNGPEGEAPYAGCGLFPIRQPGEEDPAEVCPACKTPRYLPRRNEGGLLVARNPRTSHAGQRDRAVLAQTAVAHAHVRRGPGGAENCATGLLPWQGLFAGTIARGQ
jgi:hypothetical protein